VQSKQPDPVMQVVDETNDEIVYTVRISGASFRAPVFREGRYTVKVMGAGFMTVQKGLIAKTRAL
jgi:hypothetical protein